MVQIQSTWFPLVAEPAKVHGELSDGNGGGFSKGDRASFFGGQNGSAVMLPIVKQ